MSDCNNNTNNGSINNSRRNLGGLYLDLDAAHLGEQLMKAKWLNYDCHRRNRGSIEFFSQKISENHITTIFLLLIYFIYILFHGLNSLKIL